MPALDSCPEQTCDSNGAARTANYALPISLGSQPFAQLWRPDAAAHRCLPWPRGSPLAQAPVAHRTHRLDGGADARPARVTALTTS